MGVSMDSAQQLAPDWGSPGAWDRAYEKVEDYLRAHRMDGHLQRARLIERVLLAVAARYTRQDHPGDDAIEALAVGECRAMLNAWFAGLSRELPASAPSMDGVDARIAVMLADAPARWPDAFLVSGALPSEMRRQLQSLSIKAGPELEVSHMVPRAMDIGFLSEFAGNTMASFARVPAFNVIIGWGIYVAILALLFYFTR